MTNVRERLKYAQSSIINLPLGSKYEDLTSRGQVHLIKIDTPAFPEGSDTIKDVGKHLLANLKDPPGWKLVS